MFDVFLALDRRVGMLLIKDQHLYSMILGEPIGHAVAMLVDTPD
jgi:hypothetical protein